MSLKNEIKSAIAAAGRSRWLAPIIDQPPVRRVLEALPGGKSLYDAGWNRIHPYDRANGIETSGMVPVERLSVDETAREGAFLYAGSQPGVLRTVLQTLPGIDSCSFLDLGCGKGRPLFVASEFPFRELIGVELSPPLADTARRNAAIIAQRHPRRVPVQIVTGDATAFPLPVGDFVLFLYNPFGRTLIGKVVANVEAALRAGQRRVYIVYYNPVFGDRFDASPMLSRRYAQTVPYAADEVGFGPDPADSVIIWEPGDGRPLPGAAAKIVITVPDMRAELETAPA